MDKYYLYAFIAMGILLIICFILIYVLFNKLNFTRKRQARLEDQLSGKSAEELLYELLEEDKNLKKQIKEVHYEILGLKEKQNKCFDKVKIVRYHTTSDNEAKLSYSVGLSNENGDGLVITGLQYRQT